MAVVLAVMVVGIVLGWSPKAGGSHAKTVPDEPTAEQVQPPTKESQSLALGAPATLVPSATGAPTSTPSLGPRNTATATTTASPSPTDTPVAPTSAPVAREDHYWLQRPIPATGHNRVDRYYPYASRGDGALAIHHGVEFVNAMGTAVVAPASGEIVFAGEDTTDVVGARSGYYGMAVVLRLDRAIVSLPVFAVFGHLSEITTSVGQRVQAGDELGRVGMSGAAVGPHLHFEIRVGENSYSATVNPELWLEPIRGHGTLAGSVVSTAGTPVHEARIVLYSADRPDTPIREVMTYPDSQVNPDPAWNESFATGDLRAGEWLVKVYKNQRLYTESVTVTDGRTSWVEIQLIR